MEAVDRNVKTNNWRHIWNQINKGDIPTFSDRIGKNTAGNKFSPTRGKIQLLLD